MEAENVPALSIEAEAARDVRPDTTLSDLFAGARRSGDTVKIAGRLRTEPDGAVILTDGGQQLALELSPGSQPLTPEAWVGVEGRWDGAQRKLTDARTVFHLRPRIEVDEAARMKLPEAKFLTDPDRSAAIRLRARLLKLVRRFMEQRGYLEVQTPMLRAAPEVALLRQCETRAVNDRVLYLRTDPEEYLKRYLTAGFEAVYEISTNVRPDHVDADHLQEFTSLECYRRFDTLADAMQVCSDLVTEALVTLRGGTTTALHGRNVDLAQPIPVETFTGLLLKLDDFDVTRYLTADALAAEIRRRGWQAEVSGRLARFRRAWLEWLLEQRIQPSLKRPTFVVEFPSELGLSYRAKPDAPEVCLRGELYLPGGFELAHVYEVLTDYQELRVRYDERLGYRVSAGLPSVPLDEGLLGSAALGMPPMGGLAIGLDRLLLLALGEGVVGAGVLFPHEGFEGGL